MVTTRLRYSHILSYDIKYIIKCLTTELKKTRTYFIYSKKRRLNETAETVGER